MSINHLNVLVQLAKIDGVVVQEEIDYINEVGRVNGMSDADIKKCFESDIPIENIDNLPDDEKFDYIYSIVQLMKIDGKLYNEEIEYCAKMTSKLGYDVSALFELMLKIYADPDLCADKESLKKHIQDFLLS